jgi:type II secretory pathway pseudopilin PulG
MTLLEIMIVLAILALVMGLLIGPKVMAHFHDARRKTARMAVKMYADQDYLQWSMTHHEPCPGSIVELAGTTEVQDPWGNDYKMYCGATAPAPAIAFGAASFGEDEHESTRDDIRSWEPSRAP